MNGIDAAIMSFVNQFVQRSWAFDHLLVQMAHNELVRGGLVMTFFWWIWFAYEKRPNHAKVREAIVATLLGASVTVILSRGLAVKFPFRDRPIHDPDETFVLPYGMVAGCLDGWSAFPSDHAALFFGLVTGLLFISYRLAIAAFLYVFLIITFPRIYVGLHYPTDIVGGAILGIAGVGLAHVPIIKRSVARPILAWSRIHLPSFYAFFFLLTLQVATLFTGLRGTAGYVFRDLLGWMG